MPVYDTVEIRSGSGCMSTFGYDPSSPMEIDLGPECIDTATIEHEILHTLGISHTQSRADRDGYVR